MPARKTTATAEKRSYHHGDLRAALIRAAVEELAEHGIEGFTLRGCARRAGVSHAAPAHHFGDVTGLLTAVAIEAYGRLAASMQREIAKVEPGTPEHLIAAALGYVRFGIASPAEFELIFRRERLDRSDRELLAAGQSAFDQAAAAVGAYFEVEDAMADPKLARRVVQLWTSAHGFAALLLAEQFGPRSRAAALAAALLPDLIRESFGIKPLNRPQDIASIAKAAAGR